MKFPSLGLPHREKLPRLRLPFGGRPKKSPHAFIGLDIGSHSVKWVELQDSGKRELTAFSHVPIKKGSGREGAVAAIREAIQNSGSSSRRVVSAISGQSAIARYVYFPKMTHGEVRSHIEVESDKYIPFNIKDVILDCQILEEKKEEGKIHVLVVAAKKEVVNRHLSILRDTELEAVSLGVDTFAIVNAFEHTLGSRSPTSFHALLDVGAKATNISILRGTTSLFSRSIPIGGTDFTLAISEKLGLEVDAAEVLKCKGNKTKEELLALIESPLEKLMDEVKISFDYFENQYDKRVERVYLSGGSSELSELLEYTQKSFNVEIHMWDPLEGIAISSKGNLSGLRGVRGGLAVATGLALRSRE